MLQPSTRAPNRKKHWAKEESRSKGEGELNDAIAIRRTVGGVLILAAIISMFTLLYWMGIPRDLHSLCPMALDSLAWPSGKKEQVKL